MINTALPIETPEGIVFTYDLASLSDRGKAYLLDLLLRAAILLVAGIIFFVVFQPILSLGIGVGLILVFALEWGYFVFFELVWSGQSPGKRLLKLRVVKAAGYPIGFYDSVLRNLLRAADLLPLTYATGALSILATYRFQRLGDLAADTIVIKEKATASFVGKPPPMTSPFYEKEGRGLILSNQEQQLLQEFMWRKDRLHPDRREELAAILAGPYSQRFGLPSEESATEFLIKLYLKFAEKEFMLQSKGQA